MGSRQNPYVRFFFFFGVFVFGFLSPFAWHRNWSQNRERANIRYRCSNNSTTNNKLWVDRRRESGIRVLKSITLTWSGVHYDTVTLMLTFYMYVHGHRLRICKNGPRKRFKKHLKTQNRNKKLQTHWETRSMKNMNGLGTSSSARASDPTSHTKPKCTSICKSAISTFWFGNHADVISCQLTKVPCNIRPRRRASAQSLFQSVLFSLCIHPTHIFSPLLLKHGFFFFFARRGSVRVARAR